MADHFSFPGFTRTATVYTATHQIDKGTLRVGNTHVFIETLRNKKMVNANFFIGSIFVNDNSILWSFPTRYREFYMAFLAMSDDQPVIAFQTKGYDSVIQFIEPISEMLPGVVSTKSEVLTRLKMKSDASTFLDIPFSMNLLEDKATKIIEDRKARVASAAAEKLAAERRAAEEKAHRDREAARIKRAQRIRLREVLDGYTSKQEHRSGYPVVGDEWKSLDEGEFAIRVESYSDETGEVGQYIESFRVHKETGKEPTKLGCVPVLAQKPIVATETEAGTNFPIRLFEIGDDFHQATVYPSMEKVTDAQRKGLNGGALVALQDPTKGWKLYKIFHNKVEKVGGDIKVVD